MRILKFSSLLLMTGLLFTACSDDDNGGDNLPDEVNEEEVITAMTVILTPDGGGDAVTLSLVDDDGDGPSAPEITVSDNLAAGTVYSGSIALVGAEPDDDVTEEVKGEAAEHQFFYSPSEALDLQVAYADDESDYVSADTGANFETTNPVGVEFTLTTGAASTGTLTFNLIHEPKKPNDGTLADAGGESDIDATFPIVVE